MERKYYYYDPIELIPDFYYCDYVNLSNIKNGKHYINAVENLKNENDECLSIYNLYKNSYFICEKKDGIFYDIVTGYQLIKVPKNIEDIKPGCICYEDITKICESNKSLLKKILSILKNKKLIKEYKKYIEEKLLIKTKECLYMEKVKALQKLKEENVINEAKVEKDKKVEEKLYKKVNKCLKKLHK